MEQIAVIKHVDGDIAVIEVSRKAMCDECHNSDCGSGCAMSGIFSSGGVMEASAINKIGAKPGDTVEVVSSDKSVLLTALFVFILPIILGGALYFLSELAFHADAAVSAISAIIGFALPFIVLKIFETKLKDRAPAIKVKRILTDSDTRTYDGEF